jgi:tRNA pseudouridine32 synthase/23S rRNA pseudouridine746 synthase
MTRRRPPQLPLPTRDGVGASCVGLPYGPWPTIAEFLVERFPAITREAWIARIEANDVVDEYHVPVTVARRYQSPLRVYYYRALDNEVPIPFEEQIVHRDEELLVVDKPPFVPVTPTGKYLQQSLLVRLKRKLQLDDLVPMHRIDRSTSGLVLFSVRHATRGAYQAMFPERRIDKHYEAVVPWREGASSVPEVYRSRLVDDEHFMRVREEPGEPNSETRIEVLQVRDGHALLKLSARHGPQAPVARALPGAGHADRERPDLPRAAARGRGRFQQALAAAGQVAVVRRSAQWRSAQLQQPAKPVAHFNAVTGLTPR